MNTLHNLLVNTHIVIGAVSLVLFWVPVAARKGGLLHRRAGKAYAIGMYAVSITAFLASVLVLADPIGVRRPGLDADPEELARLAANFRAGSLFLLMLSVLVFTSIHHGLRAVRERTQPGILRAPSHRIMIVTLGLLGVLVGTIGLSLGAVLLIIFGSISVLAAIGMYRESLPQRLSHKERIVAHFGGLLGSGIGAYTAFFAFGGARLFADVLPGQWQVISWIIAPVIGTLAINRLARRYRKADDDAGVRATKPASADA